MHFFNAFHLEYPASHLQDSQQSCSTPSVWSSLTESTFFCSMIFLVRVPWWPSILYGCPICGIPFCWMSLSVFKSHLKTFLLLSAVKSDTRLDVNDERHWYSFIFIHIPLQQMKQTAVIFLLCGNFCIILLLLFIHEGYYISLNV